MVTDFVAQASARENMPARLALQVVRLANGVIDPPIRDEKQMSGLHGFYGAAYTESGEYVSLSATARARHIPVVYRPSERPAGEGRRLAGVTLYGGAMFPHYGHFLLESTARLWASRREDFDHIVFHLPPHASTELLPFQRDFFEGLHLMEKVILISMDDGPITCDRLVVVEPSFEIAYRSTSAFAPTFASFSNRAPTLSIYLSRAELGHGVVVGEQVVEDLFAHLGFQIFHPQQHSLKDQLEVYRSTKIVAGVLGSALHNVLFMPPGVEVINLVRSQDALRSFYLVDNACRAKVWYIDASNKSALVDYPDRGPSGPFILDIPFIIESLAQSHLIDKELLGSFRYAAEDTVKEYMCEWHVAEAMQMRASSEITACRAELDKALALNPRHEKALREIS